MKIIVTGTDRKHVVRHTHPVLFDDLTLIYIAVRFRTEYIAYRTLKAKRMQSHCSDIS